MKNQENKFAVITGASSGIGLELAKEFAANGYDLLLIADEPEIAEAAQSVGQAGTKVNHFRVNLATHEGCDAAFAEIQKIGKPVDALCLNAGVGVNGDFVRDNKLDEEMNLIGLNVMSTVHVAKLVLPDMVKRGEGGVLITSSIAALMPGPFYATYAASKSFGLSFAEALHNELKDTGVTVTALMPGPTDTEFFRRAGMEDTKAGQGPKDDPAVVAKQAFKALMNGEDHVIAGSVKNSLQGFASRFLSEQTKAAIHRAETEPLSQSKH